MNELMNAVINGVVGILVVLIGLAFSGLRGYIVEKSKEMESNKNDTEYGTIKAMANIAVNAVEQMYKDLHGQEKLNKAIEIFRTQARKYGIRITDQQLKQVIEASVKGMNELGADVDDILDRIDG